MKSLVLISYFFQIIGGLGLIVQFLYFPFPTSPVDARQSFHEWEKSKITLVKLLKGKSYYLWVASWTLIILGTVIQLCNYYWTDVHKTWW